MANAVCVTMEQPAPTRDVAKLQEQKLYISKVRCSWFQFLAWAKSPSLYHHVQTNFVACTFLLHRG